ncbi:TonB family protein [Hymenobacter chitinivorans DSM 11115]|uniref:TonB family protein n=2 Tax=Hymenobacter chitinivorans TaxID=89969 RepID=A0A2M9B9D0_9BACT|nr:TonB family protein [Hymenobacter chitinivorans DSM 11115]
MLGVGLELPRCAGAQSEDPGRDPKVVGAAKNPAPPKQGEVFEELGYLFVEQMPVFQAGTSTLTHYLAAHVQYPAQAKKEKIQGTVLVRFMVGPEGKVKRAAVVKSRHPLLDAEALRVVSAMPAWKPGRHNGRPVSVSMTVPIEFKLK